MLSKETIEKLQKTRFCACFEAFPSYIPVESADIDEVPFKFVQAQSFPANPLEGNERSVQFQEYIDEEYL